VFSTEEVGRGWNGVYKGRDQGNESFVWHALGVDYMGNPVFRKGESTLIKIKINLDQVMINTFEAINCTCRLLANPIAPMKS